MRRKGQAPFGKRGLGASSNTKISRGNNKMKKKYNYNEDNGDFLYSTMRQVVNDGMSHITNTLMEDRAEMSNDDNENKDSGYIDYRAQLSGRSGRDGQRRGGENIPLRPLVFNGARDNPQANNT